MLEVMFCASQAARHRTIHSFFLLNSNTTARTRTRGTIARQLTVLAATISAISAAIAAFSANAGTYVDFKFARASPQILSSTISMRSDLHHSIIQSIDLEELVQSLGQVMDIGSKYYRSKSIFSERANRIKRLKGQDAMAIRMHYPIDG